MKRYILVCFYLVITNSNAQLIMGGINQVEMNSVLLRKGNTRDTDVTGSQYFNENFLKGKIKGIPESVELRYNAYTDEVEFRDSNDTIYTLIKDEKLNPIEFFKKKIVYTEYQNEKNQIVNGYLFEVYTSKYKIFKNEKIILLPAKEPRSGYDIYTPPKLQKTNSLFFLKLSDDKDIFVFPKNKNELIKHFPDKKNEINEFFKSNKLGFSKEGDLIQIVNFLEKL